MLPELRDGVIVLRALPVDGPALDFGVWDQRTGELIGNVEAHDIGDGTVNISYAVSPPWRSRGAATRAVRLALAYATEHMHARTAEFKILPGNDASLAVARRVGATDCGLVEPDSGSPYLLLRLDLDGGDQPK